MRYPSTPFLALFLLAAAAGRLPAAQPEAGEIAELRTIAEQRYLAGDFDSASAFYVELSRRLPEPVARGEALITAAWLEQLAARPNVRDELLDRALALSTDLPFEPRLYSPNFEQAYRRAHSRYTGTRARQATEQLREALQALSDGERGTARSLLNEARRLDSGNLRVLYNLALVDLGDRRHEQAAKGFQEVVDRCCDSSDEASGIAALAHTGLGNLHYRDARWDAAAESFAAAVKLDPASARSWKGLGLARLQGGQLDAAVQALGRSVAIAPQDALAARHYAAALQRAGRPADAVTAADRALRHHPERADLLLELGLSQLALGNAEEARAALTAAHSAPGGAHETRTRAALHLAMVQFDEGRPQDAQLAAEHAVQLSPGSAQGWNLLGLSRQAAGDLDGAENALATARELDPGRAEILNNLGGVYADQGEIDASERAYVQALTLDPTLVEARDGLRQIRAWAASQPQPEPQPAIRATQPVAVRHSRPLRPKKVGLRFVDLDYERLRLRGALVREVTKRSPAARAGMRKGDLVLRVDGYDIVNDKDFFEYLRRNPPAGEMEVELLRDGRPHRFTLLL